MRKEKSEKKSGKDTYTQEDTPSNTEENSLIEKERQTLTPLTKASLKTLFAEFFSTGQNLSVIRKRELMKVMRRELGNHVGNATLQRLYMEAESTFYASLPRLPADLIISKMTHQNEALKNRILEESEEDITTQVNSITRLNELTAKINKVIDAPLAVEINFASEIPESSFLNGENIMDIEENIEVDTELNQDLSKQIDKQIKGE